MSSPTAPKRRWFLKTALVVAAVGAGLGGGVWWRRGIDGGRLTDSGKEVYKAIARGVLGPMLPAEAGPREAMLTNYLTRLEQFINTMPSAKRDQISLLTGVLANAPTRAMVTGLWTSWADASDEQIRQALDKIRQADNLVQNTAYAAVRGLTCLSFFSAPEHWSLVGYPGPVEI